MFDKEIGGAMIQRLADILNGISDNAPVSNLSDLLKEFYNMINVIIDSKSILLEKLWSQYLAPCLLSCIEFLVENDVKFLGIGLGRLALAQLDLGLLEMDLDPWDYEQAKINALQQQEERVNAKIIVQSQMSLWKTAQLPEIDYLIKEKSILTKQLSLKSKQTVLRPEESEIKNIVKDFGQIRRLILSNQERIFNMSNVDDPITEANYFDQSLSSAADRINHKYDLYRDITTPVSESLYQLRFGLFLMIKNHFMIDQAKAEYFKLLLNFIGFGDCMKFLDLFKEISKDFSLEYQLENILYILETFALSCNDNAMCKQENMTMIIGYFSTIAFILRTQKEKKTNEMEEKEQLYKFKAQSYEAEDEDDEQMLRLYFPDFIAEYESNNSMQNDANYSIIEEKLLQIVQTHQMVFNNNTKLGAAEFKLKWGKNFRSGYEIGSVLINNQNKLLPIEIDYSAKTGVKFIASLYANNPFEGELQDFYTTADLEEGLKVISCLKSFSSRVNELLKKWPDHSVLIYLRTICDKIFSFSVHTPIMKLLCGIELLLQKSQDWQAYADKSNSMEDQIGHISACIVRLRKKELSSWKDLFSLQKKKCELNASKLWLNLWETIVLPLLQPMINVKLFFLIH